METDGRDTNRQGGSGVSNVVPFPRDWIGPLDDLVPLNSGTSEVDDEERGQALGAQTFWSEGSASLQQVIEAPVPDSDGSCVELCAPDVASAPPEPSGPRTGPWHAIRRSRSATPRRVRIVAASATVACLAAATSAIAVESGAPARASSRSTMLAGAARLSGTSPWSGEPLRLSRLLVERAIQRTSGRFGPSHRSTDRRRAVPTTRTARSSAGTPPVNVSYDRPQGGDSSVPGTGTASLPAPSSTSGLPVQSSPSTSSGGASDTSSASTASGPSGPGAPFGPGQMTGG